MTEIIVLIVTALGVVSVAALMLNQRKRVVRVSIWRMLHIEFSSPPAAEAGEDGEMPDQHAPPNAS